MLLPTLGVFGGTFDPVHLGHLHVARSLHDLLGLTQILMIPCAQSPLRPQSLAGAEDRLKMLQLATRGLPYLQADARELHRPAPSYTYHTLTSLHRDYPATTLHLIMGSDVFARLPLWYRWHDLVKLAHLIIVERPEAPPITTPETLELLANHQVQSPQELQQAPAGLIYLAKLTPLPIAATTIRTLLQNHQDASHLLPKPVWQYIQRNNLYQLC